MSVLLEFAMFPTDKGESVSGYVSRILKIIDASGLPYQLTPMGTIVETDGLGQALSLVEEAARKIVEDDTGDWAPLMDALDAAKGEGGGRG